MVDEKINGLDVVNIRLVDGYKLLSEKSIETTDDLAKFVRDNFADMDREVVIVINVNAKGNPLNMNIVSIGEISSAIVHPREVFKSSILSNASGFFLYHNHPSGNVMPSQEDINVSTRLKEAGEILGITLIDHVIVGAGNDHVYSMRWHNQLGGEKNKDIMVGDRRPDWKAAADEKEKKIKEMIHDIGENYKRNPEEIAEFFQFAEKFYKYSVRNTMLIQRQNPGAVFCQSYAAWKESENPVKRGEKGMSIMVPVRTTYLKLPDGNEVKLSRATEEQKQMFKAGTIQSRNKLNFKIGTVFDIGQTTYPAEDYPKLIGIGHSSEEHAQIYQALCKYAVENLGCQVEETSLGSALLKGRFFPLENKIEINELLEDTAKVSTISHEIGHALLHRDTTLNYSTARKEFEADAVSIMLQTKYGVPLIESRKDHLAEHYKDLEKELEKDSNLTLDDVFASVYKTYQENVDSIDKCVQETPKIEDSKDNDFNKGCYNFAVITNRGLEIEKRNETPDIMEAVSLLKDNKNLPTVMNLTTVSGECSIYDSNFGLLINAPEDYKLLKDTLPELPPEEKLKSHIECIRKHIVNEVAIESQGKSRSKTKETDLEI